MERVEAIQNIRHETWNDTSYLGRASDPKNSCCSNNHQTNNVIYDIINTIIFTEKNHCEDSLPPTKAKLVSFNLQIKAIHLKALQSILAGIHG